jgi:hypothetical protein
MILKILSDTSIVDEDFDAVLLEDGSGSDFRQLKNLRRLDCSGT